MEKQNWLLIILAVGLVATSVILATMQTKTEVVSSGGLTPQKDTLSVAGQGMVTTKPDQAELYIQIESKGKTAYEAQTRNREDADRVMETLTGKGVKDDDIETTQYWLDEEREWQPDGRTIVKGYVLRHTLKVTTKDLEKAGELLDAAIRAGANGVERVSFTLSKERQKEVNAEALTAASNSAKEKARAITDALGVGLGRISAISESNVQYTPYDYHPTYAKAMDMAEAAPPTTIQPSDVTVSAYINLVFEIRQ
jgi:uncharacterized protein YggE